MPKETFFNLPREKRALICDVALEEFAQYPFDQASINRIVAGSGIAKGSFYQYFDDKRDLFLFLMDLITEEKINYLSPIIHNRDELDIFNIIRELFLSGIQFANEHPRYAAIGNKLLADKYAPIYSQLKSDKLPSSLTIFAPLIRKALARNEIRGDIDMEIIEIVISSMNIAIVEYYSDIQEKGFHESMIGTVDTFIEVLKNGIGAA